MQFFINSTGIVAPETIVSLRRMDLPDVAEALNSAVGAFGAQYPRAKEDRYQILRRLAGLRFEDAERMIWRAGLFKDVEDRVSKVGTGTICVKMNEYAKRHADESAP